MATISGRHVHSLYLGVPGSAVGDGEVGWEDLRFITSLHIVTDVMTRYHLCARVEENEIRKKTYEIFFSLQSGACAGSNAWNT